MKIFKDCSILTMPRFTPVVNQAYDQIKSHLTHDHLWVRLISCQLFGLLFSSQTCDDLFTTPDSYFNYETADQPTAGHLKARDLIDAFVIQLKAPLLDNELAEQVIKNLAFMARIVSRHPSAVTDAEGTHDLNTDWLIKKVIKEAKYELVKKPNETIKRTYIFKWLAAVAMDLGKEKLREHLNLMIPILQRESLIEKSEDARFESLKRLAQEVLEFIKSTIGVEEFSLIYSKSQMRRMEHKEERKRKLVQAAVVDPQLAAQQKIRKMQKKKEAKKRKQSSGAGGGKKRKVAMNENGGDSDF